MRHDKWSKMGEENLGGPDGPNIKFLAKMMRTKEEGAFTLMKCIMNDYWADAGPQREGWTKAHLDMVMSKIYYCWCVMLDERHPQDENEAWLEAMEEDK